MRRGIGSKRGGAFMVLDVTEATIVQAALDARQRMGRFWSISHGEGVFEGVLIQWGTGESWGA